MKWYFGALLAATHLLFGSCTCFAAESDRISSPPVFQLVFSDKLGHTAGSMIIEITNQHAESCLGGFEGAYLVKVREMRDLSPLFRPASAPVAVVRNGKLSVDLSAPMCDAYLLLDSDIRTSISTGNVTGMGFSGPAKKVGTFSLTRLR
jgi:hypothetical protein